MPQLAYERGSHGLGSAYGAPVRVHWTFWFNWIFQIVFAVIYYHSSWKYIVLTAIAWGPLLLSMVYTHELGHLYANRKYGGHVSLAVLWPLGGFSDTNIQRCTCMQEFWVALCGPLTALPWFAVTVIIMSVSSQWGIDYYSRTFDINAFDNGGADEWFAEFGKIGLEITMFIFFLNLLLPVYPLDASRMLAALCVQCGMKVDKACLMVACIGLAIGLGFSIYGIIALVENSGNGLMFLLIGLFVLFTSWSLFNYYRLRRVTQHPLFQADCYTERRTYHNGENAPTRTYNTGRPTDKRRSRNSDIESPRPSNPRKSAKPSSGVMKKNNSSKKKLTYQEALRKAKKMKLGQLKRECQQRGVHTAGFLEKSQFEVAYAKSF